MKIIKLNTIASTNSFLKDLAKNTVLENFTVVVTDQQTNGRGQHNSKWHSKPFKNLTFSIFINFSDLEIHQKKYLNFAISLAIFKVIANKNLPKLSIKWPNDILSANKKIGGILIENTFSGNKIKNTIVGIGINVNQTTFSNTLKNVTSLKIENNKDYNLEKLLLKIVLTIEKQITLLNLKKFNTLEKKYLNVLYKKNITSMFKNNDGCLFMGIIVGISENGKLQIKLEDNSVKEFGVKEVSFV